MSVILVIQPDAAQGRVLHDMARRIGAELVTVESTKKAVDAIGRQVPDLILLSAFLSPRDEDTLMGRLRTLEGASHLQTMTIPQFQNSDDAKKRSGLFRKKQKSAVAVGADPIAFADEVVALLNRASEMRNRPAPWQSVRSVVSAEPVTAQASTVIDDPIDALFARAEPVVQRVQRTPVVEEEPVTEEEPVFMNTLVGESADADSAASEEPEIDWSTFAADAPALVTDAETAGPGKVADNVAQFPSRSTRSISEEIDNLVKQLGLDVKLEASDGAPATQIEETPTQAEEDPFDFAASLDRARNKALTRADDTVLHQQDAEAIRELAMAEARKASEAEIARVQAEAEIARRTAQAQAVEERKAREALTADHERKQTEAERKREAALAEARAAEARLAAERQAREAMAADLERKQTEAEKKREAALAEARAAEARLVAERQAREALTADLERKQTESEKKREAALAEARAAEARAAEERKAREALAADLAREKTEAERKREQALAERRAAEARADEERKAREALTADLERKHTEAEKKREAALAEARAAEARAAEERKAREALAADLKRAQTEAEQKREAALAEARAADARAAEERKAREALAADLARAQMEAEQHRQAAIAEAREAAEREARDAVAADLARVQLEAEQMRDQAIAARAAAESEARKTFEAEIARVRSEAHSTFTDELTKVKVEAEEAERRRVEAERVSAQSQETFERELKRVRAEVEQSLSAQLDAARAESERIRAAEAEAVRERAEMEAQLKNELDRLKFITTQARKADASETKKAAQQIKQLEAELASVRAKAEERKNKEVAELRAQMAEMRQAAAQHARQAAADAVAASVAAATPRPTAVVAQFPTREVARVEPEEVEEATHERGRRDYLSLWQPKPSPPVEEPEEPVAGEPHERFVSAEQVRRHAKWALPAAACLILVVNTGPMAISTVSSLFEFESEKKPALVVQPLEEQTPFVEMVEKRVGRLQLDTTPSGAEAILDGKSYGKTPVTIEDLDIGLHTLQLKGSSGVLTRKVTIKANQTTLLTEAIYSGWLAIFSPIPVKVVVDGTPMNLPEDGRIMVPPGSHAVEFVNEQFNFREAERVEVRPGETAVHNLTLPMGTIRVNAPEGAAILVDGQPANGNAREGLSVAIGSHEISARHPQMGERRTPVDVKHGGLTEVTLRFE